MEIGGLLTAGDRAPRSVRTGDYRLDLRALSGGGTHWAVDLVGPADKLTLTGVDKSNNTVRPPLNR